MNVSLTCERCLVQSSKVERYHQNTAYINEESNWITLCPPCRKENDEYWTERWDEYYGSLL